MARRDSYIVGRKAAEEAVSEVEWAERHEGFALALAQRNFQRAEEWPEGSPCRQFWKDEAQRHLDVAAALKKKREEEAQKKEGE